MVRACGDALKQSVVGRLPPAEPTCGAEPTCSIVAVTMSLAAGDRVGSYEIVAVLGEGGMGQVYRARDLKLGRDVALKVLPDHLAADIHRRERFQHEAKILATLNHPNVAVIYGLDDADGRVALAMELVHGTPLSERIGPRGVPVKETLKIATQVAAGLEAAHRLGIVHRDLKPANVLVTPAGGVKLVDFGIAKVLASESPVGEPDATPTIAPTPKTEEGQVLGTVSYMSPEQVRGEPVDARSDLFSFGTLLYEMLTGHRPFDAGDKMSTLAAILRNEPAPPTVSNGPALPRELERIIVRCLRKDRERRFQTASDLKLELEDLEEETATTSPYEAPAMTRRPWRFMSVAVGFVALAIAAVAALYFFPRTSPSGGRPSMLRQLTFEAGLAITPAVTPDGKLLAYASDRSGEGQLDIWLKQVAGGEPVRLTDGPGSKVNPQFSPDGTRIYFLGGRSDIYEVPALGGTSRMLVEAAGPFSVSSRGDIAFHRPGTGTAPGPLFVLAAGTSALKPWHPECVSSGAPVWAPDGTRIAFAGVCRPVPEGGLRIGEILTAPLAGGTVTRVGAVNVRSTTPRLAWVRLAGGLEVLLVPQPQPAGDSSNLYRLAFDGTTRVLTQGTGFENWPVVSPSGDLIFARTDQTPAVWSLPLDGDRHAPVKEASPARMFGTSPDGRKLVFGRMIGLEEGQLVLRDRERGTETVLASHKKVRLEGSGSFWPQVSPDGRRVVYRVNSDTTDQYLVSTDGGVPRRLAPSTSFTLSSDWSPDGRRVIGECTPLGGICELLPDSDAARPLLVDAGGGQLLYPSFSWDGRWVTFMHRRAGRTKVVVTPVAADGALADRDYWILISPDDADGARPRFSPDGSALFYQLTKANVVTIVRQPLDAATRRPVGMPTKIVAVPSIPPGVFNINLQFVITVTRERLCPPTLRSAVASGWCESSDAGRALCLGLPTAMLIAILYHPRANGGGCPCRRCTHGRDGRGRAHDASTIDRRLIPAFTDLVFRERATSYL